MVGAGGEWAGSTGHSYLPMKSPDEKINTQETVWAEAGRAGERRLELPFRTSLRVGGEARRHQMIKVPFSYLPHMLWCQKIP